MIKKILKWTLLAGLLAYVVLVAAWARDEARKSGCRGIEVVIADNFATDSVTSAGVLSELRRFPAKIVGTPVSVIDTRAIENYLDSMPQFEQVVCHISPEGMLRVNVMPMVAAARVFDGSQSYYINREGKRMPSKAGYHVDVPVISGTFSEEFSAREVLPLVRFIAADKDLSRLVGMVYARSPRDLYLVPRIQGHMVNFGDTTRLEDKRDALLAFYRKVMPYKGWDTYDTISVKFRGQVIASRKDKNRINRMYDDGNDIDLEEATLPELESHGNDSEI